MRHLLAGIALAAGQHADFLANKAARFRDVREDQVHGHLFAVVMPQTRHESVMQGDSGIAAIGLANGGCAVGRV